MLHYELPSTALDSYQDFEQFTVIAMLANLHYASPSTRYLSAICRLVASTGSAIDYVAWYRELRLGYRRSQFLCRWYIQL